MKKTKEQPKINKCDYCYGYGLWAIGDPCPMGPMDAGKKGCGMPTIPCPKCGANHNPYEQSNTN